MGSTPTPCTNIFFDMIFFDWQERLSGELTQLEEYLLCKQNVESSNLSFSTKMEDYINWLDALFYTQMVSGSSPESSTKTNKKYASIV